MLQLFLSSAKNWMNQFELEQNNPSGLAYNSFPCQVRSNDEPTYPWRRRFVYHAPTGRGGRVQVRLRRTGGGIHDAHAIRQTGSKLSDDTLMQIDHSSNGPRVQHQS